MLVPVFIASLSAASALVVRKFLRETTENVAKEMKKINSLNEAIFMKKLLNFFAASEASRTVFKFTSRADLPGAVVSQEDLEAVVSTFQDIEDLHSYMQSVLNPSIEYSKLSYMAKILPRIIVIYGVVLTCATVFIYLFSSISGYRLMDAAVGSVFGSTFVFSPLIVFLVIDFFRHESKIRINDAWNNLSTNNEAL